MSELFKESDQTPAAEVTPVTEVAPTPEAGIFDAALKEITNPEGNPKYGNVPEALNGLKNAQEHIAKLEAENNSLRTKTQEAATMEDLMAKLDRPPQEQTVPAGVSIEDVEGVALNALRQAKEQEVSVGNLNRVESEMTNRFGAEASTKFKQKANDLGMTTAELSNLAMRSPQAFLNQFPNAKPQGTPTLDLRGLNIEALATGKPATTLTVPTNIMYGAKSTTVKQLWSDVKSKVNSEYSN
jgi:hypothetical protein